MSIYVKDPQQTPVACVIWMHGLGSDANDMAGLAQELKLTPPLRHVFLDAPVRPVTLNNHMHMRAWYDIYTLQLNAREDMVGAKESARRIYEVIENQLKEGFTHKQIFLAGFSQGGAMALFTALTHCHQLGGIIALSSYLPGIQEIKEVHLDKDTPIFFAFGQQDTVVLPLWSKISVDWLHNNGFTNVELHDYPMGHSVCMEEVLDVSQWLAENISQNKPSSEKSE